MHSGLMTLFALGNGPTSGTFEKGYRLALSVANMRVLWLFT